MAYSATSNEKDHQYEIKKILKLESEHEVFLSHIATINPRNNTVPPMKNSYHGRVLYTLDVFIIYLKSYIL